MSKQRHILYLSLKGKIALLVFAGSLILSCVTEYNHPGISSLKGLLVVEGFITDNVTEIRLTRSYGLEQEYNSFFDVDNATVSVITDDGRVVDQMSYAKDAIYRLNTGVLEPETSYSLVIEFNGDRYQSEFLKPLFTPEITDVSFYKGGPGEPVTALVSTQGALDDSRYYLWSYEENWEYHAPRYVLGFEDPDKGGDEDRFTYYDEENGPRNPVYYCWDSDRYKHLLLGTSEKLTENRIDNFKLYETPPSDDRYSYIYHIKVKQNSIRKECYQYLSNVLKNGMDLGNIFSPVPSEINGNVTCLTDENKVVIGYVDVSTNVYYGQYLIEEEAGFYEELPQESCMVLSGDDLPTDEESLKNLILFWGLLDPGYDQIRNYVRLECGDCRASRKGDKNKPDWWLNDHI